MKTQDVIVIAILLYLMSRGTSTVKLQMTTPGFENLPILPATNPVTGGTTLGPPDTGTGDYSATIDYSAQQI